jgi:hypothetical protein
MASAAAQGPVRLCPGASVVASNALAGDHFGTRATQRGVTAISDRRFGTRYIWHPSLAGQNVADSNSRVTFERMVSVAEGFNELIRRRVSLSLGARMGDLNSARATVIVVVACSRIPHTEGEINGLCPRRPRTE